MEQKVRYVIICSFFFIFCKCLIIVQQGLFECIFFIDPATRLSFFALAASFILHTGPD